MRLKKASKDVEALFRVMCLLNKQDENDHLFMDRQEVQEKPIPSPHFFFNICSRIHFTRLMQSDLVFPGTFSAIFTHRSFLSIEAGNLAIALQIIQLRFM